MNVRNLGAIQESGVLGLTGDGRHVVGIGRREVRIDQRWEGVSAEGVLWNHRMEAK